MKQPLYIALLIFLSVSITLGQEQLTFTHDSEQLTFVSLEQTNVQARRANGSLQTVKLSDLSPDERKLVMDFTGWGRVWEDQSGRHRTIGDLLEVGDDTITLEKLNGTQIQVPIHKLSITDQRYVEARRSSDQLPAKFRAKVIGVNDGDTLTVLINKRQYKVRISGIDAPELGQDFATKAKKHLSSLVLPSKYVAGVTEQTDKYGRNICTLTVDGLRVDYEMLSNGLAWHYTKYSDDAKRTEYENAAKAAGLNIWSESGPIAPWDWRRWGAAKRKAWLAEKDNGSLEGLPRPPTNAGVGSSLTSKKTESSGLTHWINLSSGVRHNRSCRWYNNTKSGRACSSTDGSACKKCGG